MSGLKYCAPDGLLTLATPARQSVQSPRTPQSLNSQLAHFHSCQHSPAQPGTALQCNLSANLQNCSGGPYRPVRSSRQLGTVLSSLANYHFGANNIFSDDNIKRFTDNNIKLIHFKILIDNTEENHT